MNELAILGGQPIRTEPFPHYNTIGKEEKQAVMDVLDSGILSRYLGAWHENFYGGPKVQKFEKEWAAAYKADYAIAVNSCTSGLYAAVGATGAGPGDEIIVSPFTMSASATAALIFNSVPVFADIDPETYCLSPESIEEKITSKTKAIIVVHWFGQVADMDPIMDLAKKHGIIVIEDAAQAPFTTYKGRPVGTLGHMGVFSLNYHKHIHTGEGGIVITNDPILTEKLQLIRNHAESVVAGKQVADLTNMIGYNFRLGEMEAAIGLEQLKKGTDLIEKRRASVGFIENKLKEYPYLTMPKVLKGSSHAYYTHAMKYDAGHTGLDGKKYVQAIREELPVTKSRESEGPLIGFGSVKPLYLLPMYQNLIGYGNLSCPFNCPHYDGKPDYSQGICPTAEYVHQSTITHEFIQPSMTKDDLNAVLAAFEKVDKNLSVLKSAVDAGKI